MTELSTPTSITKEFLESEIVDVTYSRLAETLTICVIKVKNKFTFTGESACVDPANYNKEIGEKIAYDNAFETMWKPYGFWLKQKLAEEVDRQVCTAPKDDRELTDDEIKTLASGGSLCDCHEFVEGFSDLDGNERFGIDMAMAIIEDGTMSVQCEADGVMALLTPKHVDSEDWRIVDTPTPSHVTRLNVEAHQVLDRLDKLNSFLAKPRPNFISEDDWALLQEQQGYMKSYSDVLIQRINKLG